MPLELQGPRPLSPLEREAVRLVFWDSIDPCDVYLTVLEHLDGDAAAYRGNGNIRISKANFSYADALNIDSTRATTDIFKPANMNYLSRLIHECTHHWQGVHKKYIISDGQYGFTQKQLQTLDLMKEQHASAAQVYFLIEWQLEHSSDPLVNLTYWNSSGGKSVGPTVRYREIEKLPNPSGQPGPWVSRKTAEDLSNHFESYLDDLRSGGRWDG